MIQQSTKQHEKARRWNFTQSAGFRLLWRSGKKHEFRYKRDSTGNWIAGEWEVLQQQQRNRNESIVTTYRGRNSDYGKYIRKILTDYVNSPNGSVSWQNNASFV
ncbi:PREDICTED: uncharacterized protein LOC108975490 [Bactrocera latifrons]|uniref:uncharacterized protein LOC108975490 n=1 Tax=Bactrocera latifrons TaxID=174628 RepID=UPI0008DE97EA|nr:PREDICTED: uncharacterized protein LOC108975490 [Bactrocera latifrons]